nr:hypothetical protein [Tanacetum cinerariifolium]
MEKLDALLRSLTHLDKEFSHMTKLTKSYKYSESFKDGVLRNTYGLKVKLAWPALHSLLHSKRADIRENGLLMRCKLLLDESELQHSVGNEDHEKTYKTNVVIDIMSSALSLVAQINVTDRMNILKEFELRYGLGH